MSFLNKFKSNNTTTQNVSNETNLNSVSPQKPAHIFNRPKHQTAAHKTRPRGGWEDDEDQPELIVPENSKTFKGTQPKSTSVPIIDTNSPVKGNSSQTRPIRRQEDYKKFAVLSFDENFQTTHEYETKVINELIQPGGARLKQPDTILNEFCKAADTLQIEVIGSILIHNLNYAPVWISKARSIFAIECLVKNNPKYDSYFRHNIKHLRRVEFVNEGQNNSQLTKLLDDVINHLEDPEKAFSQHLNEDLLDASPSTQPDSGSQNIDTPTSSAVHSSQPGLLSTQLISETENVDLLADNSDQNEVKPSSGSFINKFKKNSPNKAQTQQQNLDSSKPEDLISSLAGLDFIQEQPKKKETNFDELYNMYLNSYSAGMPHVGPMPYAGANIPHQQAYYRGPHSQMGQHAYDPYNPQYRAQYPQYHPQFSHQGQGFYGKPEELIISPEEIQKRKMKAENEKRFENLKFSI